MTTHTSETEYCDADGCQQHCNHDETECGHCIDCGYEVSGNGEDADDCPEGLDPV